MGNRQCWRLSVKNKKNTLERDLIILSLFSMTFGVTLFYALLNGEITVWIPVVVSGIAVTYGIKTIRDM